jgi:hypothetical protein
VTIVVSSLESVNTFLSPSDSNSKSLDRRCFVYSSQKLIKAKITALAVRTRRQDGNTRQELDCVKYGLPVENDNLRALLLATAMTLRMESPCLLLRETFGTVTPVALTEPLFIGSSPHAGLRVENPTVSRFHCVIYPNGPVLEDGEARRGWYIRDLCSLNGTYLNGQRLRHPARLRDGDCVRFGRTLAAMIILKDSRNSHG